MYCLCTSLGLLYFFFLSLSLALGARVVVFCSVSVTESTIDSAQARMESYKSISDL